ncbi:MAG: DUF2778 domain-containing protein [Gammaproteobacteria bacterium]
MIHDMTYDGQNISWPGRGTFKATSGLPGSQLPKDSCVPDIGPIPEGFYKVFISDHGTAQDDGTGFCALKPSWGIQEIPSGAAAGVCEPFWANWGRNRARMEPADVATKNRCSPVTRGGFYLHDSTKGYSHGCIEVETRLFPLLRNCHKTTKKSTVIIKVSYVEGESTNGGTKI